jgi:UDP-N-acetylglucosamine 2-epimerase (non-hydrolysing)
MSRPPLVDVIAGARPNFMKVAPLIEALEGARASGADLAWRLVHTGQHYDQKMSGAFFEELGMPKPDVNLEVGSGTHAEQTAAIMVRYEQLLQRAPATVCLVVGDVNSTMACAIAAKKLCVRVAHVEGGIRSNDWTMPEEINRVVTDSITDWFFTTSRTAGSNLLASGIPESRIFFVGNTMIDTLLKQAPRLRPPPCWESERLQSGSYFVLTLHRPANVDDPGRLRAYLEVLAESGRGWPVQFPVHPRTARMLGTLAPWRPPAAIRLLDPLGYLEFNYLVKHAKAVITDSGGVTEETTVMGVPCMTLRDNTERPETVTHGTNELIGANPEALRTALLRLLDVGWKRGSIPELWDGHAGERIVRHLTNLLEVKCATGSVGLERGHFCPPPGGCMQRADRNVRAPGVPRAASVAPVLDQRAA